ncbi:DNA-binding response regulator, NarL/FixJ family, contains REC and HTH domains [Cohaesibacter marisflavi]|uniref:DNA-binding response regulator, NarL/FixJ family, contains REC and HTH domains n=1 Tax=Cohaesibacter marisflavi TaxID=655353 RepID=A0A1I5A7T7_9HYPH|nr:response regulator transcription factor [Cohaesibacter marisflavi]SFN58611.1 DNA-binding response regulator, NarL/FixJ family, contains REC and HTH domains [Cohaesibacter marisflavi]
MRIILADDHPLYRTGMKQLLSGLFPEASIDEAGDASDLNAQISAAPDPDLIISDLLFPGFDYMRDLKRLRQTFSLCPIIAVSMMNDPAEVDHIMALGVNGYVSKSVSSDQMLQAVESVMKGNIEVRLSDEGLSPDVNGLIKPALDELTPRQIEILKLLRHGLSNKEIARELDLSPFTVRSHVSALMKNLGVSNRAAASAIAASYGLN